jgi:hypothetical protein
MRPSRVRQSSWSSAIAAILLVTTTFISLPAQALVLPGPSELPPDPGVAGEATIDGIDVNVNGVRDDLELVLFAQYGNNPSVREILYHMAIYYQAMLRQPTNATVVLNNFGYLTAYSHCLESITGSASQEDNMLRPEVLNTYDRSAAYITAMDTIANVVSVPSKTVTCTVLPAFPDVPPTSPSSITVPASSTAGIYIISWSTAVGTVTRYELQQDANSSFTAPAITYSGTALSSSVTVPRDGTYYYRVRACNDTGCSNYRTGTNGVVVVIPVPPGVPSSITVPQTVPVNIPYNISWGAATGTVTYYELQAAIEPTFSCLRSPCLPGYFCQQWCVALPPIVYSGPNLSVSIEGKPATTLYYRVRACNGLSCGAYRNANNGVVIQ